MQPLPLEEIRARVLTVKPRSQPFVCCICRGNLGYRGVNDNFIPGERVCAKPSCFLEAARLEWLGA